MSLSIFNLLQEDNLALILYCSSIGTLVPYGPHILPDLLCNEPKPVRVYMPYLDRVLIRNENKNRSIIYQ